jgi:hypothetical protein
MKLGLIHLHQQHNARPQTFKFSFDWNRKPVFKCILFLNLHPKPRSHPLTFLVHGVLGQQI